MSPSTTRKPSKFLTWAEGLDAKRDTFKKKECERKAKLLIKRDALYQISFFYERYKSSKNLTPYKCSQENFIRMSKDVYKVSRIIFKDNAEVLRFFEHACDILNESFIRRGKVIYQHRGLDRYVRRMNNLRAFWEINMQNNGTIIDMRENVVQGLKRNLLYAYDFMHRKVID